MFGRQLEAHAMARHTRARQREAGIIEKLVERRHRRLERERMHGPVGRPEAVGIAACIPDQRELGGEPAGTAPNRNHRARRPEAFECFGAFELKFAVGEHRSARRKHASVVDVHPRMIFVQPRRLDRCHRSIHHPALSIAFAILPWSRAYLQSRSFQLSDDVLKQRTRRNYPCAAPKPRIHARNA